MPERPSYDASSSDIAASPNLHNASLSGPLGDGSTPAEGRASLDERDAPKPANEVPVAYKEVLQSDIGVNTLLNRLKQSIGAARDFAAFLKKRSSLEEDHAQALKRLCRSASDAVRRPDSRQGSYARNHEDITRIHERMADNGTQFALSLHQMHEDLQELAAEKERGRKLWKQNGLSAEKRVQDSESAMEKAKGKYNSLAEDYDRARTGDKQSGRFGLKGPKSAAQVEEDLNRKMQTADSDYAAKVQSAQSLRQELVSTLRPQTIQALEQLIGECDSGLSLQMQKFATFNEKMLLSNGLCVSPLKNSTPQNRSLRDVVHQIDNDQDLKNYVTSFASKVGTKHQQLKYEPHPSQQAQQQELPPPQQHQPLPMHQSQPSFSNRQPMPTSDQIRQPSQGYMSPMQANHSQISSPQYGGPAPFSPATIVPQTSHSEPPGYQPPSQSLPSVQSPSYPTQKAQNQPQYGQEQNTPLHYHQPSYGQQPPFNQTQSYPEAGQNGSPGPELPPTKPVFGVSLDDLFARDGSAVPMVVYQCIQAVDLFGLDVEGIYRLSGTSTHITKLRSMFDNDASQVDFRNPENFYHDVNSVAGLLKQFFRDLPDPLFTKDLYQRFIDAARIDDDITRRDTIHALINSLPDPNYATLRALTLHLHRVQEHSNKNRMNAGNLAISFGPTLMVSSSVPNIADAGWQVRIADTLLQNALMIFDED